MLGMRLLFNLLKVKKTGHQTDGRTDGRQTVTLRLPLDAVKPVIEITIGFRLLVVSRCILSVNDAIYRFFVLKFPLLV